MFRGKSQSDSALHSACASSLSTAHVLPYTSSTISVILTLIFQVFLSSALFLLIHSSCLLLRIVIILLSTRTILSRVLISSIFSIFPPSLLQRVCLASMSVLLTSCTSILSPRLNLSGISWCATIAHQLTHSPNRMRDQLVLYRTTYLGRETTCTRSFRSSKP